MIFELRYIKRENNQLKTKLHRIMTQLEPKQRK